MAGLAARKPFLMLERDRFTRGLREVRQFARRHREARLLQRTGKSPCAGKRIRERACISSTRRRRTPGKRGAHAPVSRNRGTRPGVPTGEPRGRPWPGLTEFENYVEHGEIRCYPLESYGIGGQFQFNAGLKPGSRPCYTGMKIGGVAVCTGHDTGSRHTRLRSRRRPPPIRFCFPGGTMTPSLERARYHRGVF